MAASLEATFAVALALLIAATGCTRTTHSTATSPLWEWEPPEALERGEGETADVHCPAEGRPPPVVRWSFNAIPFHEWPEDGRRILLDGGRLLRIRELNRDSDTGLYQCNATNLLGSVAAATFLNVQAFAPRFRHSANRVWKVLRNSVLDVNCDVEAAPKANVRWVDANDSAIVAVPGKLEFLANHTLRLHDVSSADDGFYYCNVSNKFGINRAMNRLEVFNPTYLAEVPHPPQLAVDAFDSLELRCRAMADPRLSVEYVWTHNGRAIGDNGTRREQDGSSVLRLDYLRGRVSGRIECAAVTDVDVKSSAMELLVRDVPEPPELLRVDCSSGQHALVVWRRPDEHGSPLTHFTVDALGGAGREAAWETVWEERLDASAETKATGRRELYKTAIPLAPWVGGGPSLRNQVAQVNYTFRMFAHNAHGASEPALSLASSPACLSPPDVPFTNPRDVRAQGTEPDNLVVRWTPLPRSQWNAPGLRYLVRYRRKQDDGRPSEWREFFVEDPFSNQTVIREQPTFRPYFVKVRAVNSRGFSAVEPPTVLGWSGEDVPLLAPKGLRLAAHRNHSAVTLQWEPVPADSVRGHFRGYRVDHWPASRPFLVSSLLAPNASATVGGLHALQEYVAKVHVLNEQHESEPSDLLQFRTREGTPSKVHNLRVYAVGARSVLATWEPPLHPNGHLRGYFLNFENLTSGLVEETFVLHRQLFYLHELLWADTPLRVAVWAETGGGEGPKTWRHTRTWPNRDPDSPLFSVRSVSPSLLRIHWLPSGNGSHWRMSGSSFLVNYTKDGSDQWTLSEAVVLPQTVLELRSLEEGADYTLVGVAREGPRLRHSRPLSIRTESSRVLPPFSQERLRSAAWFLAVLVASLLTLALVGAMCLLAQRSALHPSGLAALRLREKRFGPAFRYSPTAESELEWMAEGGETHRRFLLDAQKKMGGQKAEAEEQRKETPAEGT